MSHKNIVWIVIDALRADHLGCYGYMRNTSPTIDHLAKQSVLFEYAFAPATYTVPVMASLLTSKYPHHQSIGFDQSGGSLNPNSDITVTEALKSCGYQCAGFVSSMVLRKHTHFDMGFDVYDAAMTKAEINRPNELVRDGQETRKAFSRWLEKNYKDEPFFVFLHYFDVHGPYVNPEPFNDLFVQDAFYGEARYVDRVSTDSVPRLNHIPNYQLLNPVRDGEGNVLEYEKDIRYYIAQYDGGISYEDTLIRETIAQLKELDIYDECLIIITADHGESLGENDVYFFHGLTVTPDQTRVPLIIKPPKELNMEPKSVPTAVSTIDIMPTILDFIGYQYDRLELEGVSLVQLMQTGEEPKEREIVSEIEGQIAYVGEKDIVIKPKEVDPDHLKFIYNKELCEKDVKIEYRKKTNNLSEPEWTGERYHPLMDDPAINYEHLHRYQFAGEFVKDKVVLDLACGEGYGSHLLAGNAKRVIGIDIDGPTIRRASQKYFKSNLEFIIGSITDIPIIEEHCFDTIICFEALEHVKDHDRLMSEVKRLLKENGLFIVSTPDKRLHADRPDYRNPFHLKELYLQELKVLLERYFKKNLIYGQKVFTMSNIFPTSGNSKNTKEYLIEKENKIFTFTQKDKKQPLYFIALSSDAPLSEDIADNSYLVDISGSVFELQRSLQSTISQQEAVITEYAEALNRIYQSYGWKALSLWLKVRDLISGKNRGKP